MNSHVVCIDSISKKFGKNTVFENCSMTVDKGAVFGLVGLNGSGKTTFLRMLLGLLKPDSGTISVCGCDPWKHSPAFYKQLGVVLDNDGFSGNLTIAQNIDIFAQAKQIDRDKVYVYIKEAWKDTFIEREFFEPKKKVKYLSRGQKMQCALCRAFLSWPGVYFLDEPTVALDADACDHFYDLTRTAQEKGATVCISSHQLSAIEDLCTTVALLQNKTAVTIVSPKNADGCLQWRVRCAGDDRFGEIIRKLCDRNVLYSDGFWRFTALQSGEQIPGIVSALVAAGAQIHEVCMETDRLKDRIRSSRS
jgi:ABC-2 type transport system ATP-binding protein